MRIGPAAQERADGVDHKQPTVRDTREGLGDRADVGEGHRPPARATVAGRAQAREEVHSPSVGLVCVEAGTDRSGWVVLGLMMMTDPVGHGVSSGHGVPVLTRTAMSNDK